jgi:dihydroxyacetone kinase
MKKIINAPETFVIEMCKGIVRAHPELDLIEKFKVIKRKEINKDKVILISGGGSGHEPAHAGLVGKGMLDAAVCGDIFASPSTIQVYNAITKTQSKKGTLLIIKNYSGDCMNFDGAMAMAREDDDIDVESVYVNDDIAVKDSLYTVGRRGVAGTIFVHKISGAAAEIGKSLKEVKAVAEKTIANTRSIGFALTSCTVPAKGSPTFNIGENEIEYGVGIHGEPGIAREPIASASVLAKRMVSALCDDLAIADSEIALLINGFGGTPLQELYLFNNAVSDELEARQIKIYRTFVGNFMTSIDMAGASISVLRLDPELKSLLDAQSDAPAFKVKV